MNSLCDPVPPALLRGLRDTVLELRSTYRGTRFPVTLCAGLPGAGRTCMEAVPEARFDHALRAEVVGAMLHRARSVTALPALWLARPGELSWHDLDAEWLAAALTAYAEASARLTFVVVTKRGWYDPRSGARRQWKRLRQRT